MKRILLFGGSSEERLVAVASAQNVLRHTSFDELCFVSPELRLFQELPETLLAHERAFERPYEPRGPRLADSLREQTWWSHKKPAVVFIAMHGGEAENGKLQAFFEGLGVAYTGSRSQASHLEFHKDEEKIRVQEAGVRVAGGDLLPKKNVQVWLQEKLQNWGGLVVKPVDSGSSFGLFFIASGEDVDRTLKELANFGSHRFLVEEWVRGRELTVGVVQQPAVNDLVALPPSEVQLERGRTFDYQGKYFGQGVKEVTPADLTEDEQKKAQALAILAHRALGCYGYSRTDMILTTSGECVFLETNTLPGLSAASFIPQQLAAAGIPLSHFIKDQINLAIKKVT